MVEMLVALAIGSVALMSIFAATMVYMKIWKGVSGREHSEVFNQETVTRNMLINEVSRAIMELNDLKGSETVAFRKLNGEKAASGSDDAYFYWQSKNELPFLKEKNGGITECWLKWMGQYSFESTNIKPAELRLYYRSLKPTEKPQFGGKGEVKDYIVLIEKCKGINFGYTELQNDGEMRLAFYRSAKIPDDKLQYIPELVQILLPD